MRESPGTGLPAMFLRWAMLIVVAANIGFIVDYSKLSTSATIAEVVADYGGAWVPAAFVTAIGAALLVGFLGFFAAALRPRRWRMRVYDRLVVPVALASALAAGWLVAFRHREMGLSVALVAASVVVGAIMFARVAPVAPGRHSGWLRVPFSLYFGAMSIALPVALSLGSHAGGLLPATGIEREELATALLAITAVAGGIVALRYRDFVYPLVMASVAGSMFLAQHEYDLVALPALVDCIGMLVVAALAAVAQARQVQSDRADGASRRRGRTVRGAEAERWYLIGGGSSIMRI
jgi:benzodiazapine receptor